MSKMQQPKESIHEINRNKILDISVQTWNSTHQILMGQIWWGLLMEFINDNTNLAV